MAFVSVPRGEGFCGRHDAQAVLGGRRHQLLHPFHADSAHEVVAEELERIVRAEIPRHHLDPDHDIDARPGLGCEAEQREFRRKLRALMRLDERIDSRDIGVDACLRPFRHLLPCGPRGAPEADGAKEAILVNSGGAENLRKAAVADAALELHLPQPVLRVHESQAEQRVGHGRRENMRNGVGVTNDVDGRRRPAHRQLAVDVRKRPAHVHVPARAGNRQARTRRADAFTSRLRMTQS